MTSESPIVETPLSEAQPVLESTPCLGRFLVPVALALLTAALMLFGDYQLGSGNQAIQIPFLKHFLNPQLFANDDMVKGTLDDYPSYFFKYLSVVVGKFGLEKTFLVLHFFTTFAFIYSLYLLAMTLFSDWLAALFIVLFGIMGHHQALAGDPLYFNYFTHTWFVFPLAIFSITLFLRGWTFFAFALAGVIFNLHALTAAYLAAMLCVASLRDLRFTGWKIPLVSLIAFILIAVPTLGQMIAHKQVYNAAWLSVMHWRSSDHSFASSWWDMGNADIPRFLLLIAIGVLSMAFPSNPRRQRRVFWMGLAVVMLFFIGWLFSESPLSSWLDKRYLSDPEAKGFKAKLIAAGFSLKNTILRAQFFRSSRLLMVLIFAQAAGACAGLIRRCAQRGSGEWFTDFFSGASRWIDLLLGFALAGALAFPPMIHFLPWVVSILTVMALVNGRLAWPAAIVSVASLTLAIQAHQLIGFHIPFLPNEPAPRLTAGWKIFPPALFALGLGVGLLLVHPLRLRWWANAVILLQGLVLIGLIAWRQHPPMGDDALKADPWIAAQLWAKNNTPADAVFLVPPSQGGFRIFSERSVVGEWRDGTQAYFKATYAGQWWERMKSLMPNLNYNDQRVIDRGKPLETLQGKDLASLAKQYDATYLVLPKTDRPPRMRMVYGDENPDWQILLPDTYKPMPTGIIDEPSWLEAEDFMNEVCLPNIEKYRKGDVKIAIVDAAGKPVKNLQYEVKQTRQAFLFGATLPFFKDNVTGTGVISDERQDPIKPAELAMFPDVFNFSMIGFSGKWMYTEPTEGIKRYDDLDAYVDWCVKNKVDLEYHFLSGIAPRWTSSKSDSEMERLVREHALEIMSRYQGKIRFYQVVNDDRNTSYLPSVVKAIRQKFPDAKLGISNCTRVSDSRSIVGVSALQFFANRGGKLDFYAPHAHMPRGIWADPREMYEILDAIAEPGYKIHASELIFPLSNIIGDLRSGRWTTQLQADYVEWFYTILFSHPASESINYWNFTNDSNQPGAGLLTSDAKPTLMYNKLKELIRGKWMTNIPKTALSNGEVAFRGFHGEYELKITLPDGTTAVKSFSIEQNKENGYRFVLDQGQLK